jgi:hypothetical protein
MDDPDFAWHVRCLPYRSGEPDIYQAILRHAPTGLAGWGMGYSREQAHRMGCWRIGRHGHGNN